MQTHTALQCARPVLWVKNAGMYYIIGKLKKVSAKTMPGSSAMEPRMVFIISCLPFSCTDKKGYQAASLESLQFLVAGESLGV